MDTAVAIVVPVFVCVILPIVIVWIVFQFITNRTNKRSEIILEAIKGNPNIDTEKLLEAFKAHTPSPWENLSRKLLRGSIFTLLGITFAIIGALAAEGGVQMSCWIACGVFGSIGIGFLITYVFTYKNIQKLSA